MLRQHGQTHIAAGVARLRENQVQRHAAGPVRQQVLHQRSDALPRPRPWPQRGQAGFVYIDHQQTRVIDRAGLPTDEAVPQPGVGKGRLPGAPSPLQEYRHRDRRQGDQPAQCGDWRGQREGVEGPGHDAFFNLSI